MEAKRMENGDKTDHCEFNLREILKSRSSRAGSWSEGLKIQKKIAVVICACLFKNNMECGKCSIKRN